MKDPWLDTWRQHRLPLEVRFVEPIADGDSDDLQSDEPFQGADERPLEEHQPTTRVDPETGERLVEARLVSRLAVARALEHLLWAWQRGAVLSFSMESSASGTRISIVYPPSSSPTR